jgi:hypothetical protein
VPWSDLVASEGSEPFWIQPDGSDHSASLSDNYYEGEMSEESPLACDMVPLETPRTLGSVRGISLSSSFGSVGENSLSPSLGPIIANSPSPTSERVAGNSLTTTPQPGKGGSTTSTSKPSHRQQDGPLTDVSPRKSMRAEKMRATGKNRTTVDEGEIPTKRKEQKRKRGGHTVQASLASLSTSSSLMDMDVDVFYDLVSFSVLQIKLFQLIV